nr:hypothetical protein [Sinorhizobium meliloti]
MASIGMRQHHVVDARRVPVVSREVLDHRLCSISVTGINHVDRVARKRVAVSNTDCVTITFADRQEINLEIYITLSPDSPITQL